MKLLRSLGLVALVMSSGVMACAKDVKDMSEAEKEFYYKNERIKALIGACIKGELRYVHQNTWRSDYHHPVLQYVGPCGSLDRVVHESDAAEVRDLLRESRDFLNENAPKHLYQAALKWHNFKECTDLEGKTGAAVERIRENRRAFLKAIDDAVAWEFPKRDFNYVPAAPKEGARLWSTSRDSCEAKIAQAARKTLHYKHPVIHRLQKLFGKKKENWA